MRWAAIGVLVFVSWLGPAGALAEPVATPTPTVVPMGAWGVPEAQPAPGNGGRWIHLRMRSDDRRTRIDRVLPTGGSIPVCFTPCDAMLDSKGVYIIQGDGVRPSSRFALPDDRDSVALTVNAGSTARATTGAVLGVAGLLVATLGLTQWLTNSLDGFDSAGRPLESRDEGKASEGKLMMEVGVMAGVLGFVLAITADTKVISSTGSTFARDPSTPRRPPRFALSASGIRF